MILHKRETGSACRKGLAVWPPFFPEVTLARCSFVLIPD